MFPETCSADTSKDSSVTNTTISFAAINSSDGGLHNTLSASISTSHG
jgi:hypothetical protein